MLVCRSTLSSLEVRDEEIAGQNQNHFSCHWERETKFFLKSFPGEGGKLLHKQQAAERDKLSAGIATAGLSERGRDAAGFFNNFPSKPVERISGKLSQTFAVRRILGQWMETEECRSPAG